MNQTQLLFALRLDGDGNRLEGTLTRVLNQDILLEKPSCVMGKDCHHRRLKCSARSAQHLDGILTGKNDLWRILAHFSLTQELLKPKQDGVP